ncbi:MAG: DNA polymerase I [Rhodospirillaceae bacterium]|nr:MAG: DNA polymerase I [Rhodospirillaceae bacterium]
MKTIAPRQVILIDGAGYVFRAFHALPPLSRPDGTPVNAVYGFTTMLMRLLDEARADHVGVIFDAARRTFRNDLYPDYKANRPPPPEALVPQFPLIREAVRAFNVAVVEQEGFEADDLIATYTRAAVAQGAEVRIFSADKDLMQLVGPGVVLWDPLKNRAIGPEQVREKFGVGPERVVDVQALAGDSIDNVPGVPGIGVKTAAELITRFGTLETLLSRAAEISQPKRREALMAHAAMARLSHALVRLKDDVPVTTPLAALEARAMEPDGVCAFLRAQGFHSLLSRFESRSLRRPAPEGTAPPGTPGSRPVYSLVQSLDALDQWLAKARAAGVVAVDTETDSLDSLKARLVGVSLSITPGEACYIPLDHSPPQGTLDFGDAARDTQRRVQIPIPEALERLRREILENHGVLKVGHNIKFDMHVLHTAGQRVLGRPIRTDPVDDTMVLSYVLNGSGAGHGMDDLAEKHLGLTTIPYKVVCGTGKTVITFDQVPLDTACAYAAEDADVTLRFHRLFRERLLAERMMTVHETLDRPLIPVLVAMERAGILVDESALRGLAHDFAARMAVLGQDIHRLAGESFNIASPKQLGVILFERLALPGGKKSAKSGSYGTDAAVLESLAAQGHDLPARVLEWRQLAKLKSTYAEALLARRDTETGRVHTSFSQAVTTTGRLSSNDPNLQNIPIRTEDGRRIRRAFIAPPGHVLLSADYSQIELRVLAHVADIKSLKEAFSIGADIHAVTASEVFGVPAAAVDPLLRRRAKAINFGIIYGQSPFGLAAHLGISQGEARAFIEAYFARYPEIRGYMEATKAQAHAQGFVTTFLGRKCMIADINDRNANTRAFAERAAINAPIQGGAADIIKRAMTGLPVALAGLGTRLLLQVHDELVFEMPETEVAAASAVIRSVMEGVLPLSVPLVVDIGSGHTWADAH